MRSYGCDSSALFAAQKEAEETLQQRVRREDALLVRENIHRIVQAVCSALGLRGLEGDRLLNALDRTMRTHPLAEFENFILQPHVRPAAGS